MQFCSIFRAPRRLLFMSQGTETKNWTLLSYVHLYVLEPRARKFSSDVIHVHMWTVAVQSSYSISLIHLAKCVDAELAEREELF